MIEPSSGRTTTSGPGAPLLLGFAATAVLVIGVLIGFQLGSGQERVRTVIVGASGEPAASREPSGGASDGPAVGRILLPKVDSELQQAYYANLRQGSWVVCSDGASLACKPTKYKPVDGSRGFEPPETYANDLPQAVVAAHERIYLVGNIERVWVGSIDGPLPHRWARALGVTLNGSVQFIDLGNLAEGRYVIMDRSVITFEQGPVSRAFLLTVRADT